VNALQALQTASVRLAGTWIRQSELNILYYALMFLVDCATWILTNALVVHVETARVALILELGMSVKQQLMYQCTHISAFVPLVSPMVYVTTLSWLSTLMSAA